RALHRSYIGNGRSVSSQADERVPRSARDEADPPQQIGKSSIVAKRIEHWIDLEHPHQVRALVICTFEPDERLFAVTEAHIRGHERRRGNVRCIAPARELLDDAQRIWPVSGACMNVR